MLRYDRQPRTLTEMIITNVIHPPQCWVHGYGLARPWKTSHLVGHLWTSHTHFSPLSTCSPIDTRSSAPTLWLIGSPAFERPAPKLCSTSARTIPSTSNTVPAHTHTHHTLVYTHTNIHIHAVGEISIQHATLFLSKYISKGAIDMTFSTNVGNYPSNPYIQRNQN